MQAEIISIGDELTSGQRLDTNSQWLSQRLGELGIRVLYHTTVADDLEANIHVFRQAFDRAEVILCTGGLGPTADDLTRQAIADATRTELVLDEISLAHIEALFAKRKRKMPVSNKVQAMFPSGSRAIPNPHGSAPGIDMEIARPGKTAARIFALPGVPAEMRQMWQATVEPLLTAIGGTNKVIRHRRIKCFGVGESDLEQMLPDLIRRGRSPSVGITVSKATITLRITAEAATQQDCYEMMEPTIATIRQCLGEIVFGSEDDELQHVVARLLSQRNQTIATAEWGPGGLLSNWISQASGQLPVFLGGIVVNNAVSFGQAVGVDDEFLNQHGEISAEAVEAMALASRNRYGADYGLAIGAFPQFEADPDQPDRVYYALSGPDGVKAESGRFMGHPDILTDRTVKQALNFLRLSLLAKTA